LPARESGAPGLATRRKMTFSLGPNVRCTHHAAVQPLSPRSYKSVLAHSQSLEYIYRRCLQHWAQIANIKFKMRENPFIFIGSSSASYSLALAVCSVWGVSRSRYRARAITEERATFLLKSYTECTAAHSSPWGWVPGVLISGYLSPPRACPSRCRGAGTSSTQNS
jgi:hypothetical protein